MCATSIPKKNDVIEQVTPMSVNLGRPLCCPLWEVVTDQTSANEEREKVAEGGAWGRTKLFYPPYRLPVQYKVPVAEQKQTANSATGNLKRNPDTMERKIEPGMAKVWRKR